MNNRLVLSLINRRHRPHQGFALVFSVGLGLVILVISAAMLIRGQEDQNKVVSQTTKVASRAAAETAVARYTNFLNNNRGLIRYPSCATINSTTGNCDDVATSTTVKSWATANAASANLVGIGPSTTPVSGGSSCDTPGLGGTLPTNYQTVTSSEIAGTWAKSDNRFGQGAWQTLSDGGRFRLVDYRPNASWNATVTGASTATLTVEGEYRGAKSRLQLELPVAAQLTSSGGGGGGFPGLWARNFSFSGTAPISARVYDSYQCIPGVTLSNPDDPRDPDLPANDSRLQNMPNTPLVLGNPSNPGQGNHPFYTLNNATPSTSTPIAAGFPNLPTTISTPITVSGNVTGIGWVNYVACPVNSATTFPRSTDRDSNGVLYGTAPANATYNYYVCSSSGGKSFDVQNDQGNGQNQTDNTVNLGVSGQETLKFYLAGNFEDQGNLAIAGSGSNRTNSRFYIASPGRLIAGSNDSVGIATNPKALQFYIYGADNTGTHGHRVEVGGNAFKSMFIFAPQATVNTIGTGDIAGAVWANVYNGVGNGRVSQGIFDATGLDVNPGSTQVLTYSLGSNPVSFREVEAAPAAN